MAKQAADFIAATVTDPELAEAFVARVGDRPFEQAADDVVAFARERGYALARTELLAARTRLAEAAERGQEVGDAELAGVNGGILGPIGVGATAGLLGTLGIDSGVTKFGKDNGYFDPKSTRFWFAV